MGLQMVFLLHWAEETLYDYQAFWYHKKKSGVSFKQLKSYYKNSNLESKLIQLIFYCMSSQ